MIGAIIGDIVGSKYEHNNIKTKEFEFFNNNCWFTDDTVMSLAVADAIIKCNGDYSKLEKYAIDSMVLYGKRHPHAGYGRSFKNWFMSEEHTPYGSYGNGAAMRVSACGLIAKTKEEAKELSTIVTNVSHNHIESVKAANAVAESIYLLKNGFSKDEVKKYIIENYYDLDFTIDGIRDSYMFDVSCQGSVPQAMEAFFESNDFEDAIRNAISIGGDSDTIASITGALASSYYEVPNDIKEKALSYLEDDLIDTYNAFELKLTK